MGFPHKDRTLSIWRYLAALTPVFCLFFMLPAVNAEKSKWEINLENDTFAAVIAGNQAQTAKLMSYLNTPNIRDAKGRTLLFFAPSKPFIQFLIKKGVNPAIKDFQGNTAADAAGERKRYDLAAYLQSLIKPSSGPPSLPPNKPAPPPIPPMEPPPALPPLPPESREDVLLSLNKGKNMDMTLGEKFLRLRVLVRVGGPEAKRLGFIPKEDPESKAATKAAFGEAAAPFGAYDFVIMDELTNFFTDAKEKEGRYFHPAFTHANKQPVAMSREQLRHLAAIYLRRKLGYGWIKSLVFPYFVTNK